MCTPSDSWPPRMGTVHFESEAAQFRVPRLCLLARRQVSCRLGYLQGAAQGGQS